MKPVLQRRIPYDISTPAPLPGVRPLGCEPILLRDEAFGGQMQERDRLLRDHRDLVLQMSEQARASAEELLGFVLSSAYPEQSGAESVLRPDGVKVRIDWSDPLATVGRLTQQDFCILQKQGDEHVLTGAVLCFPASWTLSEKFLKPMVRIHRPVATYDEGVARRVQRLFDGVQVGKTLWRFNILSYAEPNLFSPRSEANKRTDQKAPDNAYLRSERQVIFRLPQTGDPVFCIHTYIVPKECE